MNAALLVLCLVILILLLAVLILMVHQFRENDGMQQELIRRSQESIRASASHDQKISQDFDILLNQMQTVARHQSGSSQVLDWMQSQVDGMAKIMTNTKARGNWGEYQLESLLSLYAGENPSVFDTQVQLENGKIADAVLHLPGTKQVLCIDSKFPMENYRRMCENPQDAEFYEKNFRLNMKKHIDDVADKYITDQTLNSAVLFVPSEAIYEYICGSCPDTLDYALSRHVLLTSPTTLAGTVFTLLASTRDFYRASHLREIEKGLLALKEDVERLETRLEKARRGLDSASSALSLAETSARSLSKRYDQVLSGKDTNYAERTER